MLKTISDFFYEGDIYIFGDIFGGFEFSRRAFFGEGRFLAVIFGGMYRIFEGVFYGKYIFSIFWEGRLFVFVIFSGEF